MCTPAQARRAHAVVLQRMTKTTDPATRTSDLTQILTVRRWTLQAAIDERLPGGRIEHGPRIGNLPLFPETSGA